MPSRKRLEAALTGRPTDRVPFFEMSFAAAHVDGILGRHIGRASNDLAPNDYAELLRRLGVDCFYHSYVWPVGRVYRPDSGGQLHYVDGSIKSRRDFSQITVPDVSPVAARLEALAQAGRADDIGLILGASSPYKLAQTAVGYEDFLIRTMEDEAFLAELIDRLAEPYQRAIEKLLDVPLSAFLVPGDLCGKNGPLLCPDVIERLWLRSTVRFLEPIARRGIPIILHADGDFSTIADVLLQVRPDALHPFEVCGDLDIYGFKQQHRDVTVMGNIDLAGVLSFGTPQQVRESVRQHIERLAGGGRYICGSSHEISPSVPVENLKALAAAVHEFGAY